MMEEAWKNFMETGSVVAYLDYRNSCVNLSAENEFVAGAVQGVGRKQQSEDGCRMMSESSYSWGEMMHGESYSDRHGDVGNFL